jgi:hypothetical protein
MVNLGSLDDMTLPMLLVTQCNIFSPKQQPSKAGMPQPRWKHSPLALTAGAALMLLHLGAPKTLPKPYTCRLPLINEPPRSDI